MTLLKITFMTSDESHLSETQFGLAVFPMNCRNLMTLLMSFMSSDESDLSENQSSVSVFT